VTRRKPRSGPEYEAALERILAESERTTALIGDLMLLARGDANVERFAPEPVEMVELVRETCADAGALANAADIRLKPGNLAGCSVSGDRLAVRRLLLVLVDNAIKYSKPGGEVEVNLELCHRGGRPIAHLEVRDDGIGISADDLPHISERFYRASKDRSRRVVGLRLGLSIAQSIARQHGGEVQVESTLGQGTTARLLLPAL